MRIRLAIPDRHVTAPVLDAALEATTRAAQSQMQAGEAPTFTEMLAQGVRWAPEHFTDGEHFDLPAIVGQRGYGDCDDLAPSLAAELRIKGTDPGARARVLRSAPNRWHAIVELSDGRILDPSKMAGMGTARGVSGAIARPMASVGQSAIAVMPHDGEWWARTDVPVGLAHLASSYHHTDMGRAVDRSIAGALACGGAEFVAWPHYQDRATLGRLYRELVSGDLGADWIKSSDSHGPMLVRF